MKIVGQFTIGMICLLSVSSCADLFNANVTQDKTPTPASAQAYREKALTLEDSGELQRALMAWQVAAAVEDDQRTQQAIRTLKQTITTQAESYFQQGLAQYQAGNYVKALTHFLNTIRLEPAHKGARYYLKTRLHSTEQAIYKVRRGDSYSKIAAENYGDPQNAYLIAYYNNQDPLKPLLEGTTLILPVLDPESRHPRPAINLWMAKAQEALNQKRYDAALVYVAKLKKELPGNAKVLQMSDQAHFAKGMIFLAQQQYLAALKDLKQVRPSYKGSNKAITQARHHLLKQALEEKLQLAEKLLSQKEYDSVINITEEILSQTPANEKAKALSNEAQYTLGKQLLERGDHLSAAAMLQKTDATYKDTKQLLSLARARIRSQAEKHYRQGVNHFINEDLERAVAEWRKALDLNPNHPKARQDIVDAERLLKKYQTLDADQ